MNEKRLRKRYEDLGLEFEYGFEWRDAKRLPKNAIAVAEGVLRVDATSAAEASRRARVSESDDELDEHAERVLTQIERVFMAGVVEKVEVRERLIRLMESGKGNPAPIFVPGPPRKAGKGFDVPFATYVLPYP